MTTLDRHTVDNFVPDVSRYQHSINEAVVYTDGVQYVAEAGNACWLLDAIAAWLQETHLARHVEQDPRIAEMHFWKLTVDADRSAVLEARVDASGEPFIREFIQQTDFPLHSVDVWAAWNGHQWTLFLPSEY
ncbi:hypothetical protein NG895_02460 [Aeoliella sp. ICT_H6.2]|uniref:DUF6876 domain-containing protein n=1 Tax=Aeoliella straminimaris TaxID=2954799 RepID=A0A9X2JE93_9BACT|nr:DUF6876 family protein [Aeoliella straminimaris]MCO6042760.1 hypothetical protein [Aeoliella straminimaris]